MSKKKITHNYDFRTFNLLFVAKERDVWMDLFGYLERDLRDFAKGAKK